MPSCSAASAQGRAGHRAKTILENVDSRSAPNAGAEPTEAIAAALTRLQDVTRHRGSASLRRKPPAADPAHHPDDRVPDHTLSAIAGNEKLAAREGHSPGRRPKSVIGGGMAIVRLMEVLASASRPMSVSEIATAIGVDQARASRLVQEAAVANILTRQADELDGRRTVASLTALGMQNHCDLVEQRRAVLSEALSSFDASERAELGRLLTKLAKAWSGD